MKKLISLLICIAAIYIVTIPKDLGAQALRVLLPVQGGTGISTSSPTDIGKCIKVLSDSPFKYELASCGGIGGDPTIIQIDGTPQSVGTPTLNFTGNSFAVTESPADTFTLRVSTTTLGLLASSISDFVSTVRTSISETIEGLTYTSGTGVLSLDSGYTIPTTTRAVAWDNKGNGTVTSVDMSVPTGLTIAGNPITTTGTLALSLTSGYTIPSTTRMVNADTAFSWGNHASQGYITDGNTNWDNSYGYVTQGQTVGTTTAGVAGEMPYWTGIRTLGSVATGTLTENITGLNLSATRGLIGGSSILQIDAGYSLASTSDFARINTAFASSTAINATTPLTYTGTTGNLSIQAGNGSQNGYISSTDWTSFNQKVSSTSIDTLGELETLMSGTNIIASTEINSSTLLAGLLSDETGSAGGGLAVFSNAPTFTGTTAFNSLTVAGTSTLGNATSTTLGSTGGVNFFGGGLKTTANALCIQLTGGSDLCDGSDATGGSGSAKQLPMLVVATSSYDYPTIQQGIDALPAGGGTVNVGCGTWAPFRVKQSNTRVVGQGVCTQIAFDGVATTAVAMNSVGLTNVVLENFYINNTNGTYNGIGLSASNTPLLTVRNIKIGNTATSVSIMDTSDQSFYQEWSNLDLRDNKNCVDIGGNPVNDNSMSDVRCAPASGQGGIGLRVDSTSGNGAQSWTFKRFNVEPTGASTGITGIKTLNAVGITFISPYIENVATAYNIGSGSQNINFFGGIFYGNTTYSNAGKNINFFGVRREGIAVNQLMASTTIQDIGSSDATVPNLYLYGNTNFARTAPSMKIQLMNVTDSGSALQIINPGTGASLDIQSGKVGIGSSTPGHLVTIQGGNTYFGGNTWATGTASSTYASTSALTVYGNAFMNMASSTTSFFSGLGTFTNLVVNTLATFLNVVVTGLLDVGGGVLEIPNGTAPVVDSIGEIGLDSSDDQLIMADGGGTARVFGTDEFRVVSLTMASSSLQFDSGDLLAVLGNKDGLEITQFRCYVVGGTSKVVNLTDGTNDTETITCGTTMTSDTDVATNDTFTADEIGSLEMGATTGVVNYLHFEAWGRITRE